MNVELLRAIANASAANTAVYVSATDGVPLLKAGLINVDQNNKDPQDANKVAAHVTDAGVKYLTEHNGHVQHKPMFSVQSGIELPKTQRRGGGGGGAPTKYPFDGMEIGHFFFVANTAVDKGDAFKTLSSAVGSANQRYAVETGEHKTVNRAKRGPGNKAIKGADGKNVMESATTAVKKMTRKFVVRAVKAGVEYGSFTAPADGAVVARVEVKADEHVE